MAKTTTKSKTKETNVNFTKAYQELEAIVASFETGEIDLEKDMAQFEKGMKLAAELKGRLQEIDNAVTAIKDEYGVNGNGGTSGASGGI